MKHQILTPEEMVEKEIKEMLKGLEGIKDYNLKGEMIEMAREKALKSMNELLEAILGMKRYKYRIERHDSSIIKGLAIKGYLDAVDEEMAYKKLKEYYSLMDDEECIVKIIK